MIANLAGVAALLADGVRALLVLPIRLALTAPRSCSPHGRERGRTS